MADNLKGAKNQESDSIKNRLNRVKFTAIVLLFLICLGLGYLGGWLATRDSVSNPSKSTQKEFVISESHLIRDIAKQVGDSVVSINSSQQAQSTDPFDLFGDSSSQTQESAGTGIIISSKGVIMTNRHVVPAGTTNIRVTLSDGTTYKNVKVIGRTSTQQSLDVAFLQIQDLKGKQLKAADLGDSSQTQIGDRVVAIGNALGQFQNTVTSGIISGHGRSVQASGSGVDSSTENLQDLFQTDAAINEGNSGGPLVNTDGQVIGMNTAVAGGNAQNIGFSIPINDLKGLIDTVLSTGKFEQPYLGVLYVPLTKAVAEQYNLKQTSGAYILLPSQLGSGQDAIQPNSPAANAGLKPGDIIIQVNGHSVDESHSLTSILDEYKVGEKVTLKIIRGDTTVSPTVTLGKAPESNS